MGIITNQISCDILYSTSLWVQICGTSITAIVGVLTAYNVVRYLNKRKMDALFGFYSQLYWHLETLYVYLGGDINNKKISDNCDGQLNILLAFSEDTVLKGKVNKHQRNEFEVCRVGIIDLFKSNNSQFPLKFYCKKKSRIFNENLKDLFVFLNKYHGINNNVDHFTKNISEKEIDHIANQMRNTIFTILREIDKRKFNL